MATRKSTQAAPAASVNDSSRIVLSQAAQRQCPPFGTIILDLASRIGALDKTSRSVLQELLRSLVEEPDEAAEIARLVGVLATVQTPIAKDAVLNRLLTLPDARSFVSPKGARS